MVIPDQETYDLEPPNDILVEPEVEVPAPIRPAPNVNPELSQVAHDLVKIYHHCQTKLPQPLRHVNRFT